MPSTATAAPPAPSPSPVALSRIRELLHLVEQPGILSLAGGLPAPLTLDADRVRAAADRALSLDSPLGPIALQYGPTEGQRALRELIADRETADVDQVLVTTGSQQAIDLLARSWCHPGDVVVVEDPSYLGALQSFGAAGCRTVGVPGDDDGFDVDRLDVQLRTGLRPRLVYVVPNFHNPTGTVLPEARRRHLASLADRYGFLVIEDDPYHELRFTGANPPPIRRFGTNVVRLGSASKVLGPGLRVGWMVGPDEVVERASRVKQAADLHTPSLNQLIVADLLADATAQERHLANLRAVYAERAGALHAALLHRLGDRIRLRPAVGGMFLWADARDGTDADRLFEVAIDEGVAFVPGSAFAAVAGSCTGSLRLSFATLDPDEHRTAAERLARAWDRAVSL